MYGPPDDRVPRVRVRDNKKGVYNLVAIRSGQRGSQNLAKPFYEARVTAQVKGSETGAMELRFGRGAS
jgi:hypothetical protein